MKLVLRLPEKPNRMRMCLLSKRLKSRRMQVNRVFLIKVGTMRAASLRLLKLLPITWALLLRKRLTSRWKSPKWTGMRILRPKRGTLHNPRTPSKDARNPRASLENCPPQSSLLLTVVAPTPERRHHLVLIGVVRLLRRPATAIADLPRRTVGRRRPGPAGDGHLGRHEDGDQEAGVRRTGPELANWREAAGGLKGVPSVGAADGAATTNGIRDETGDGAWRVLFANHRLGNGQEAGRRRKTERNAE